MELYDSLDSDYDVMTDFDKRLARERPVFRSIVSEYDFKHALDAGCGSGLHSILLSELGLEVVGIDCSEKMIRLAQSNAKRFGKAVPFIKAEYTSLAKHFCEQFDSLFCLGNAFAHILDEEELQLTLVNFRKVLQPGGYAIIQLLNYSRILKSRQRMVGITERKNKSFIRFYDFKGDLLHFNILIIERGEGSLRHRWIGTDLYPWRLSQLENSLKENGFTHMQYYADLQKDEFDKETSKNLVILCQC